MFQRKYLPLEHLPSFDRIRVMKIEPKIGLTPPEFGEGLCVYGEPQEEVRQWCAYHGIQTASAGRYTNLVMPEVTSGLFKHPEPYQYLDGFSPNLNKHLHLGHLSNLVLAKAFQSLDVSRETIAILGDTLPGQVSKEEALASFRAYCDRFNYPVHYMFFASEMVLHRKDLLEDGTNDGVDRNGEPLDYVGTKVFNIEGQKIVGLKSDGSTTYFYQDVALASTLNESTLYLTGSEQNQHFGLLKKLFPHTDHVGLGLVLLNGLKMSSRNEDGTEKTEEEKKEIYAKEILEKLNEMFGDDHLAYNVLAGHILKAAPKTTKKIDGKTLSDVNISLGLYISYTNARLCSAGIEPVCGDEFRSWKLSYAYARALWQREPNWLFMALFNHCTRINSLYRTHRISGSPENHAMFSGLMLDLQLGLKKLGLYSVERVDHPESLD